LYELYRRVLASALGLAVVACTPPPTEAPHSVPSDAAARAALVGTWTWSFLDADSKQTIVVLTRRREDGTFSEEASERTPDGPHSLYVRSGDWYVTAGVLKTHTKLIGTTAIGRNSRLAFQTYPLIAVGDRSVTYRVSRENGRPGQWPRVLDRPARGATPEVVIEETRVEERIPQ
jgi:hypothetical protein